MQEITDGYYDGQILSADIIRSRYAKEENDNRMEVELTCGVYDNNHQPMKDVRASVFLELSADFPKFGDTTKPFWQQTMAQLHELGMKGDDLTTLEEQLKGKPCRLNYRSKDKNGCLLKNPGWYLTRSRERVVLKGSDANNILRQMMGGSSAMPSAQSVAPSMDENPFN